MSNKPLSDLAREGDLEQLLDDFTEKIRTEWSEKWTAHGEEFVGVEGLPSKNAFYHELADALNDAYKIRYGLATAATKEIKVHTVRRILEQGADRNFDDKTRDVLAVYLGYANWAAYRMREHLPQSSATATRMRPVEKRAFWMALAGIGLLVLAAGWLYGSRDGKIPADDERLILIGTATLTAPAKVAVRYDLRGLDPRQARVVFDSKSVKPQLEQGQLTFEILLAQAAPIQLYVADKLVCEVPVAVYSTGWEGYLNLRVPIEKSAFYQNGQLHFSPNLVPRDQRADYYPAFLNFRDYGLSADAMRFEARVLNNEKIGGLWAYDVSVDLVGTKHRAYFNVLAPDAILYAHAGAGKTELSGSNNPNLQGLGVKMEDWCVLTMQLLNQQAVILIDGKEALRFPYQEALGELRGIQFYIKGSGAVDWVRITDLKDNKVKYFDDFLGEEAAAER